jgi:hypothetical protein
MPRTESDRVSFLESPAPKGIRRDLVPACQAMSRLKNGGLNPDFVIDVGSSTDAWSDAVQRIFENARFVLADPLISKYVQPAEAQKPLATPLRAGRSRGFEPGRQTTFRCRQSCEAAPIAPAGLPLWAIGRSSGLSPSTSLQKTKDLGPRDPQNQRVWRRALVLEGAARFLSQIDVVVIWVSLADGGAEAFMEDLGFRYFDDAGDWRSPVDGTLLRKEAVFLRNGLLAPPPAA